MPATARLDLYFPDDARTPPLPGLTNLD